MPRASIVILTWNGREYLADCLSTALAQDYPDYEVVVVDNASTDGSADFVAAYFPHVRLVRNPINLGFGRGMNVGIRVAAGEVVALLNQDATVAPHWLAALDRVLADDPAVGIAGCKVLYPDRATIQHAGGVVQFPTGLADHIGYRQPDRPEWNRPADVDYVTGAALAIRRDVLTQVGLFDEGFFPAYYEETDLCWRARAAGFRVRYVPDAVAYHYESSSVKRESEQYYRYFHAGRLRFVLKHWTVEQVRDAFVPAELERLHGGLSVEERRALHFAYRHARQTIDEVAAYRQQAARPADFQAGVEKDALGRAVDALVDAAVAALQPAPATDPLAVYHRRMVVHASVPEPAFQSSTPVVGGLLVVLRRAWNWMSTKWYVRPMLQEQNQFNDATLEAVAELCVRMGQVETAGRIATIRLDAAEHSLLDTHTRVIHVEQARARVEALEARALRAEQDLKQALDRVAELEATVREMEATAAAVDRQTTGIGRDVARLALRLRRFERGEEAARPLGGRPDAKAE